MIEELAIVRKTYGDRALVETQRKSSCGGCEAKNTCGTSLLAKFMGGRRNTVEVCNPIGAKIGESVVVGINESALTYFSFLFYILPLITLFAGALIGKWLALEVAFASTEPLSILCGLLGLSAGLYWLKKYTSRNPKNDVMQAIILRRAGSVHFVNQIN